MCCPALKAFFFDFLGIFLSIFFFVPAIVKVPFGINFK
jgi:hypothetical protein